MKLFISYGREDDEAFVKRLCQDLAAKGIEAWWDRTSMPSRGLTFNQEIRDAIEEADRLLLIVGPSAVRSGYVRTEWEYALLFAKGVLPILRLGDYSQLPEELRKVHCPDFRASRPYNIALAELLRILAQPVVNLGPFLTVVPALPPQLLFRQNDLAGLSDSVLADVQRPIIITSAKQTVALQGMGGIGKSVLAAAFARSAETRRAFKDGIIMAQARSRG
jgi:hypothetical protein